MYIFNFITVFYILFSLKICITKAEETYSYVGCYIRNLAQDKSVYSGTVHQCIEICEKTLFRYAILSPVDKCGCSNKLLPDDEKLDINICNIRCSKNKIQYCGGIDAESYYTTGISGAPRELLIAKKTNISLELHWEKIRKNDQVTSFVITASVLQSFAINPIIKHREWTIQKNENRFELSNLHPGTTYNISVKALCGTEYCGSSSLVDETLIGVPDTTLKEPKILNRTDTAILIELTPGINNNGPITYYRIVVQILDDVIEQEFDETLLVNYDHSRLDGIPYYITAEIEFKNQTINFQVGDGSTNRGFLNAPLPSKAHVHILLGIVSTWKGVTTSKYSKGNHEQHSPLGMIFYDQKSGEKQPSNFVLIVACVVFAIFLIFSVIAYIFLRYKTTNQRQRLSDTHELTMQNSNMEMENNISRDELVKGNFKTQLNSLFENLDSSQKFPRNAIRLNIDNIIANGHYGEVLTGSLYLNNKVVDCQVHVVSDDEMEKEHSATFLKDFNYIAQSMPHDKFVNFFGVSASPDWFYVIFEMYPKTLKKVIVESRLPYSTDKKRFSSLSEECVLQWIYDISLAMEYLEVNKIYHKHLCSHNVYLTELNKIKVSLFGPTQFADFNKSIDISRWLAPEVLCYKVHSSKSDVWSFACLAWECCTLGATPFGNITTLDLLPRIKNGVRPEQPVFIFSDLYQLFLNCWQMEPSERSDFEEIAFNMRQILTSPQHSISFERLNDNMIIPYYLPLLEIEN